MINEKQAQKYCCEDISNIENYDKAMADKTQIWHCHHRAEVLPCGRFSIDDLKKHGLYWKVPVSQLIFLTKSEHTTLHHTGKKVSSETRRKMSEAKKGKHLSEETRMKMSEAKKGHEASEESRRKMSKSKSGEKHPNFGKSLSDETRRKISEALKRYLASKR